MSARTHASFSSLALALLQVTDIFKKEGGLYARFAVCLLVDHGYQTRVGVITAGEFGVSQVRGVELMYVCTWWCAGGGGYCTGLEGHQAVETLGVWASGQRLGVTRGNPAHAGAG